MKTKTETVFKTVMKSPRSDGFIGEFYQYYRGAAIQTVLCQHQNRHTDQWNQNRLTVGGGGGGLSGGGQRGKNGTTVIE